MSAEISPDRDNRDKRAKRKKILIKIGGEGADDRTVVDDLARLVKTHLQEGHQIIVVHGGGKSLTEWAQRCGVSSRFVKGRRVTDDALIDLAQMVFVGQVGTRMMSWMIAAGISAVSLSGISGGLIQATKRPPQRATPEDHEGVDYGWVGDIERIETRIVETLWAGGFVPLVASLGGDGQGFVYNINADTIACRLAEVLGVDEIVFLTKLHGVLERIEDPTSTIRHIRVSHLTQESAETGLGLQTLISEGMIPKLAAIERALQKGVARVEIRSWMDLGLGVDRDNHRGTVLTLI